MIRNRLTLAVAAALLGCIALAGCKKKEEIVAPPVSTEPAPMATPPAPVPMPAATASVSSVDLGNAAGADMKVSMAMTTFKPKDTIIAAVSTMSSDAMASVPGKLGAKWTFQDGQTVHEETRDITFAGKGVTDFQISKPSGWPVGKYKVEVSLDGNMVQSKDFEVK